MTDAEYEELAQLEADFMHHDWARKLHQDAQLAMLPRLQWLRKGRERDEQRELKRIQRMSGDPNAKVSD